MQTSVKNADYFQPAVSDLMSCCTDTGADHDNPESCSSCTEGASKPIVHFVNLLKGFKFHLSTEGGGALSGYNRPVNGLENTPEGNSVAWWSLGF